MLRLHQTAMAETIEEIRHGAQIKTILAKVTPGGGKSTLPIIAGRLIGAKMADALCWVCPRLPLTDQAERNFLDLYFRRMLGHNLTIRAATNDHNPARGTAGFVTTYQALGVDKKETVLSDFRRRRYILVLDEYHHAGEDGIWTEALRPLYDLAAYRVLMTGTLARGDKNRIAFTPYETLGGDLAIPVLRDDPEMAVIEYSRKDALIEKAILPIKFSLLGGTAKWETITGKEDNAAIETKDRRKASSALYTALRTGYAYELLENTISHWRTIRARNRRALLLVVAASIETAKEYLAHIDKVGIRAEIATSENADAAVQSIKRFKAGRLDALVTVAMAYEGLDCPPITHIACLTNIRSVPWIEQMVARAVRVDPLAGPYEEQCAYVYAPDDQLMRDVVRRIEADQDALIMPGRKKRNLNLVGVDLFGEQMPGITPLSSVLSGGNIYDITAETAKTQSEIETELLREIESHVRQYSFANRYNPKKINWELVLAFGKSRGDMTVPELSRVLAYCKATFPLWRPSRGTGNPRVPTKARPIAAVRWAID